ncbi:MAG: amino acid adenylation domain-containing protein [Bacteroidales bacterium]|nr:amino acid adenylation domain-containing protein [Bacteroidales bacterium]MBN2821178.1 amino acid adenylation domain-containing protein [Bacteroidales bacterium]
MEKYEDGIAIIGMSCRFPGANNIVEYWNNLLQNKESIHLFTDDELKDFEYDFENIKNKSNYVKAKGIIEDIDKWDAGFFNTTPRDAEIMDPQLRLWLSNTWHAFEDAGIDPYNFNGNIGVYAGSISNYYLLNNVLRDPETYELYIRNRTPEIFQAYVNSDPMFLATHTAYFYNLKGTAISMQTACSTALVAVSQACNSLFAQESDVCIAGGVTVVVPQESGYIYNEGAILSPDGHCRSFDKDSKGTVFSNGVGTVVLKRLEDAVADNDRIYAVLRGWSTNNDGNEKIGFTAPSIEGQRKAISSAYSFADIDAGDICYIEAHGTATPLGDPIEVKALTKAFREYTDKNQFCGLGSVKSNIGHLDAAAGVAGLIKVALSAYHKFIPATLHFKEPNPLLNISETPFFVVDKNIEWNEPRLMTMGVSSFGVGGTNAHVILSNFQKEEPENNVKKEEIPALYILSAKSEYSVKEMQKNLQNFIQDNPDTDKHQIAASLQFRRAHMPFRSYMLSGKQKGTVLNSFSHYNFQEAENKIVFLFPGQGAQYINMGKNLFNTEEVFRQAMETCFSLYHSITGSDIKPVVFTDAENANEAILTETRITQPALFIIEYALAQLYSHYGIQPNYCLGHSIGEYTAACISGVFDLETALKVVIKRGELMYSAPKGSMMAVPVSVEKIKTFQGKLFEIAAINSPNMCTISYPDEHENQIILSLEENELRYFPLNTSHGFHSSAFEPIMDEFATYVNSFELNAPTIPFISCLTGDYITSTQATSGQYWAAQLRNSVLFSKGIDTIAKNPDIVFIEVGPNTHLKGLVQQNNSLAKKDVIITSLGKLDDNTDQERFYKSLGETWIRGIKVDFSKFYSNNLPEHISLPPYAFEKNRYWIDFKVNSDTKVQEKLEEKLTTKNNSTESKNILEVLLDLWKEQTQINDISIGDNFFEIGGNSLIALQLINRIKDVFDITITLKDFLENDTIEKLSKLINLKFKTKEVIQTNEKEIVIELEHIPDSYNLPLTGNQKRLWLIYKMEPDIPSYIITNTFRLSGSINYQTFEQSFEKLFNRHHIVFSRFKEIEGEPYCEIVPEKVKVNFIDYSKLSKEDSTQKINKIIESDSKNVFNLNTGPLFRLYLFKSGETEHIFHFSIHHIVFDGWSWSVFANDFIQLYNGLLNGKDIKLNELKYQLYDYAKWEDRPATKINQEKSVLFWQNYLKDSSNILNFPYDYQRKENPSGRGSFEKVSLTPEISDKLRKISKEEGVSLFSTMFGLFGILIHKYSNDKDLNIGLPVAYRPHSELEKVFGMFVNTVVVRLYYNKESTFRDLIHATNKSAMDAIDHQDLAFDKVVEIVKPGRVSNINPLFQVSFAWQNNLDRPINIEGVKSERIIGHEMAAEFDLSINLWELNHIIQGTFEYNVDILKKETIIRLKKHFIKLIENLIENLDTPISSISLATEDEIKLISELNNTSTDYPRDKTIIELFEEQVQHFPEKKALVFKEKFLTYKQLNEKANQLARTLRKKGVSANNPVALLIEKSLEAYIGMLGILKAGGGYVPIDPELPVERIQYLINDSGCRFILTTSKYSDIQVKGTESVDLNLKSVYDDKTTNLDIIVQPTNLAYIIYTSGTTGLSKGTTIPHRGVVRLVKNNVYAGFTAEDNILQSSSIVFDASVEEIFGALLNGSSLHIITKEMILDPQIFSEIISTNNITVVGLTSALFSQLAEYDIDIFSKVELLILGGDVVSVPHVNKLRKHCPSINVLNTYGPTENSVNSTFYKIDKEFENNVPIGKPISNSTAYIFDEYLNLQPVGVIGELYVGGDGVSLGYLNRDDLNKKCFIENPVNPRERLYKTGDYVKLLPDGNIEFQGRVDNQIKIRGLRVELEEIESVISGLKHIRATVVKPFKIENGDYRLVAFIDVPETLDIDIDDISKELKAKLPAYMIPSAFKIVHGFPKNSSGKIDRKKIDYNESLINNDNKPIENISSFERKILDVWINHLKYSDFGIDEDFFQLGGSSLLSLKLISQIEREYNCKIPYREFLLNLNTVKKMAAHLKELENSKGVHSPDSIKSNEFTRDTDEYFKESFRKQSKEGEFRNLVIRKPTGHRGPLFLVNAAGLFYFKSIDLTNIERKIYNYIDIGSDGEKIPFSDIPTMAKAHVEQLLEVEPEGPYFIGGFSFGGLIAYEMTQQLLKLGKKVPCILLLDTFNPQVVDKKYKQKRLRQHWKNPLSIIVPYINKRYISKTIYSFYFKLGKPIPIKYRQHYVTNTYLELMKVYFPEKLNTDLMLFRAEDNLHFSKHLGWDGLVNNLDFVELEGHHLSIFENKEKSEKLWNYLNEYIKIHDRF